ncbi:MAG: hypothetical protein ACE5IZ_00550 [Dehalococcoidia bacterium]
MKTRARDLLRNLVVTPPLMGAGMAYGVVVGFLIGWGMAALLGDQRLGVPIRSRWLRVVARAVLGAAVVTAWVVVGMVVGGLLPIVDRGTFVGILRYGLPLRRQESPPPPAPPTPA